MNGDYGGVVFVLVVLVLLLTFVAGGVNGYSSGQDYVSQAHCENLGKAFGKFDNEIQQIVCWDEIPAVELEE